MRRDRRAGTGASHQLSRRDKGILLVEVVYRGGTALEPLRMARHSDGRQLSANKSLSVDEPSTPTTFSCRRAAESPSTSSARCRSHFVQHSYTVKRMSRTSIYWRIYIVFLDITLRESSTDMTGRYPVGQPLRLNIKVLMALSVYYVQQRRPFDTGGQRERLSAAPPH